MVWAYIIEIKWCYYFICVKSSLFKLFLQGCWFNLNLENKWELLKGPEWLQNKLCSLENQWEESLKSAVHTVLQQCRGNIEALFQMRQLSVN